MDTLGNLHSLTRIAVHVTSNIACYQSVLDLLAVAEKVLSTAQHVRNMGCKAMAHSSEVASRIALPSLVRPFVDNVRVTLL